MSKKIDDMWENLTEEEREELFNKYSLYFYKTETKEKVGFNNDTLFLLSIEEYEKYKDRIPHINCWWWLRSPGTKPEWATSVYEDGSVDHYGHGAKYDNDAVRPVLRIARPDKYNIQIGMRTIQYDFPWIVIDKDLAIAEVPIAFRRFDEKSNDYANSEIRKFLFDWMEKRQRFSTQDTKHEERE